MAAEAAVSCACLSDWQVHNAGVVLLYVPVTCSHAGKCFDSKQIILDWERM